MIFGGSYRRGSLLVAFVVATHGAMVGLPLARADDATPPAPVRFTSLAPDGARSEVNVEFMTGSVEPEDSSINVVGLHLDAQYVVTRGTGGYVRLGVMNASTKYFGSEAGFAGTEVGGFQRLRVAQGFITGRVGVSFPTRPDFSLHGFGVDYVVRARRPSDLAWLSPDDASLRLAATPTYSWGPLSARLDAGLDTSLARSAELGDSTYHVDVAVGVQRCAASATVEFSTFGYVDGAPYFLFRRHALTISAQYRLRRALVSARVGTPFTSGEFNNIFPGYDPSPVEFGEHIALALGLSVGL